MIFLLIFVLVGYDGHNHVHHRVEDHNKSIRKPRFAIHALCHEEDLKSWLLNINFKKEDLHGLSIGAHPRYLLSVNFLAKVIEKIHGLSGALLYAVGEGK